MREMNLSIGSPAMNKPVTGRRLFLLVTLLTVALAITACGRRPVPPEVEMTPVSGSVEAPAEDATSTDAAESDSGSDTAAGDANSAEAAESDAGDEATSDDDAAATDEDAVVAVAPLGPGSQAVIVAETGARVYADAGGDAPVLQLYNAGELMEVLAPSGDYDAYPVVSDDREWVRVRAADGLVGWLVADAIEAAE